MASRERGGIAMDRVEGNGRVMGRDGSRWPAIRRRDPSPAGSGSSASIDGGGAGHRPFQRPIPTYHPHPDQSDKFLSTGQY